MTSDPVHRGAPGWLADGLELLNRRFGHEIPERQHTALHDLIERLAARHGLTDSEHCLSMLRTLPADASLVQGLLTELTNKESYFFRDAPTVASLRDEVLPPMLARAKATRVLRVWSAGCSTGEELYTLSILLHELLPNYEEWNITLVGSDIDLSAIEFARRARYKLWSLRATDESARRRYFDEEAKGHVVLKPKYRRNVSFQPHNLADLQASPPAPGQFDLILCRNVTIYFSATAQAGVATKFERALSPDGVWIAGPSDPAPRKGFVTRVLPGLLAHFAESGRGSRVPEVGPFLSPPSGLTSIAAPNIETPSTFLLRPDLKSPPAPSARTRVPSARPAGGGTLDLEKAKRFADAGDHRAALVEVNKLILERPLVSEPYLLRASLHEAMAAHELACADLRRVLFLAPDQLEAGLRLGLLLARLGDKPGALTVLRAVASMPVSDDPEIECLRVVAARHFVRLISTEVPR